VTSARDSRRIATILRFRRSISGDPLKAHRLLGNALLVIVGGSFFVGALIGVAVTLAAVR
jgi:VIT1/CCC1 family predicted Fe2+/Mn2+ transporter